MELVSWEVQQCDGSCFFKEGQIQRQQRRDATPEGDASISTWKRCIEVEIIVVSASSDRLRMGYLLNRLLLVWETNAARAGGADLLHNNSLRRHGGRSEP
jgi:hypothetical protein